MKLVAVLLIGFAVSFLAPAAPLNPRESVPGQFAPPAVPLVANDPYFSIWSQADKLTDRDTTHWTGKPHRLMSLLRIDGKAFRVMGASPTNVPALEQKSLTVLPTRTIYTFAGAGVELTLTFMTPALPDDLAVLSRPVTYVTWDVKSSDGKRREVELYFDASGEIAVNDGKQIVTHSTEEIGEIRDGVGEIRAARIGPQEQAVLAKKGDDLRIDWGYFYVAAVNSLHDRKTGGDVRVLPAGTVRDDFAGRGVGNYQISIGFSTSGTFWASSVYFGRFDVEDKPVSRFLILAYDDLYSIEYMHSKLRPYWRRNGWEAADL